MRTCACLSVSIETLHCHVVMKGREEEEDLAGSSVESEGGGEKRAEEAERNVSA